MTEEDTKREHYESLLRDFDHAMLVTHAPEGDLRARPMRIVAHREDGTLVFVTHRDDAKVDEILLDGRVNVTLQSGHKYVSITGEASTSDDVRRIGDYYNSSWQVWFPGGAQDPNILLIDVDPTRAEFWDGSGWKRVQYAMEAAKAVINEERIKAPAAVHGNVTL